MTEPGSPDLTAVEHVAVIDIVNELGKIKGIEQFMTCVDVRLQQVLPHGGFICGIADITGKYQRPVRSLFSNLPTKVIEALDPMDEQIERLLVSRWCKSRAPLMIELADDVEAAFGIDLNRRAKAWLDALRAHDYRNAAVHGMADMGDELAAYFCFIRIPARLGKKHSYLLTQLIPHLHAALARAAITLKTDLTLAVRKNEFH
ncbi:MAG: hypothetical protein HY308_11555 [Gammaproteobacteria bacterium]|nr:hypothetical protein [Gammaproteobacteria bacterium]